MPIFTKEVNAMWRSIIRLIAGMTPLLIAGPAIGQTSVGQHEFSDAIAQVRSQVARNDQASPLSGAILIARDDQVLYHEALGFADWEHRTPNTTETRFGIGSIAKPLTGVLVDIAVSDGKLDLGARVDEYVEGFPSGPNGGAPTVNDLLVHRSGVPHRVTTAVQETQPLLASDIVEKIKETGLLFEPGAERHYSSAGFTSLARVIEVVTGNSFDSVLNEYVLVPAGMTSTVSETGQSLMAGRARPYRLGTDGKDTTVKSAPYKDLRFLTGAGSVYSTTEDLLRFVHAIEEGVFGEGYSEQIFGGDSTSWQGVTGRTNGYEASVDFHAEKGLIFVFLSNIQSASNWQLRAQIQSILLGEEPAPLIQPPPVGEEFEDKESIQGTYGRAVITLVGGKLFRGDNEFYPVADREYYIPASGSKMRFRRDSSGQVDALISINAGGRETVLPRTYPH